MHFSWPHNKAIDNVYSAVATISGTTESMLLNCLRNDGNQSAAETEEITQHFARVKAYRKDLDSHIAGLCSKAALPTDKTRRLIALGHIALELENIAKLTTTLASGVCLDDGGNYDYIYRSTSAMGKLIKAQLKMAIDALMTTNKQRALQAWLSNADIHEMQVSMHNEHLSLISTYTHRNNFGAHILLLSKNLEKIADCSKRITEFAYEISTGQTLCAKSNTQRNALPLQEMAS